jgi:hypothetical protein
VRVLLAADVVEGAIIIGKLGISVKGLGIGMGHRTLAATDERGR